MTEHFLHRPQVSAPFQKMRRKRVPQSVRSHCLRNSNLVNIFAEDFPRAHSRHRLATRVEEKNAFAFSALEFRSLLAKIDGNRTDRTTTDGNQSFLGAFAEHPDQMILQHD